jgi:hypothetical protein
LLEELPFCELFAVVLLADASEVGRRKNGVEKNVFSSLID